LNKVLRDLEAIFGKSGLVVGHSIDTAVTYTRGCSTLNAALISWEKYQIRDIQLSSSYAHLVKPGNQVGLKTTAKYCLDHSHRSVG
jgi:hypothetical protein